MQNSEDVIKNYFIYII